MQQDLLFVGNEEGKLIAIRNLVKQVSFALCLHDHSFSLKYLLKMFFSPLYSYFHIFVSRKKGYIHNRRFYLLLDFAQRSLDPTNLMDAILPFSPMQVWLEAQITQLWPRFTGLNIIQRIPGTCELRALSTLQKYKNWNLLNKLTKVPCTLLMGISALFVFQFFSCRY